MAVAPGVEALTVMSDGNVDEVDDTSTEEVQVSNIDDDDDDSTEEVQVSTIDEDEEDENTHQQLTQTSLVPSTIAVHGDLLEHSFGAESVWDALLDKGSDEMQKNQYSTHLVAFEVGAHSAAQSVVSVKKQFHTHCFEPSPASFKRIQNSMSQVIQQSPELQQYIHLHNVAAGGTTGDVVEFSASGGTGDHIGKLNGWKMTLEEGEDSRYNVVEVTTMKLDDLIYHHTVENEAPIDEVYAIKIDTQGFEPSVFEGLEESIKNHKIKYVLTEYWPNGMALMRNNTDDKCGVSTRILSQLTAAGYSIYALPIQAHATIKDHKVSNEKWREERPLNDFRADCEYMLELEKRFPHEEYRMVSRLIICSGTSIIITIIMLSILR